MSHSLSIKRVKEKVEGIYIKEIGQIEYNMVAH